MLEDTQEQLPIVVSIKGLFEPNDKSALFLIEKLQAWLNFRALTNNWFVNENSIVSVKLEVMPEPIFDSHVKSLSGPWNSFTINNDDAIALNQGLQFHCCLKLNNEDVKKMMGDGKIVEPLMQLKLTACINYLIKKTDLTPL